MIYGGNIINLLFNFCLPAQLKFKLVDIKQKDYNDGCINKI